MNPPSGHDGSFQDKSKTGPGVPGKSDQFASGAPLGADARSSPQAHGGDGGSGGVDVALPPKHHPPGLYLLFIVEMWERFSYYGMRALLVLYLIRATNDPANPGRGWSEGNAYLLYGWYTGLAYLVPLIGGFLADKFLGTHRSMIIGGIIIALGHVVLGITGLDTLASSEVGMSVFMGGLILIVLGTGYFKPCVSVMVGQLYGQNDPRRDGAFTIFYMGINLGAFGSGLICGTLGEIFGWHWGFGAAAVGMVAGLITYMVFRARFLRNIGDPPAGKGNYAPFFFLLTLALAAILTWGYHLGAFGATIDAVGGFFRDYVLPIFPEAMRGWILQALTVLVVVALSTWFVAIQRPGEKGPTASIFIFMLFNVFFWIAFEQAGSVLNVFAEQSTDRTLFNWTVPATWFQSLNPLVIILAAPLFAIMWSALGRRNLNPSQPAKIGLGLVLLGIGYVFMVFAALKTDQGIKVGMFWLSMTYIFHTFGELCLSPTGLSYVTKAAPARFVSLLMGIWFISSFLANLGGGLIARYVEEIERGELRLPWYDWGWQLGGRADYFMMFVITSFGSGLLILVLVPLFKKLLPKEEQ